MMGSELGEQRKDSHHYSMMRILKGKRQAVQFQRTRGAEDVALIHLIQGCLGIRGAGPPALMGRERTKLPKSYQVTAGLCDRP